MHTLSDVAHKLEQLFGTTSLITEGVVHVTSSVRTADGRLHAIKIGDDAPKSESDFFILNLCRARADALLTSAGVVRAEPHLSHRLSGPWAEALAQHRREVLRKIEPPECAILSKSSELPLSHPIWSDGTHKLILTASENLEHAAQTFQGIAEIAGPSPLDARGACTFLHERGDALVSVEAGPGSAAALYETPSLVDELLLTEWLVDGAPSELIVGPELPPEATLFAGLTRASSVTLPQEGGRFRFERWLRASGGFEIGS